MSRSRRTRTLASKLLIYVMLAAVAVTTAAPFWLMLTVSLIPDYAALVSPFPAYPHPFGFNNFAALFQNTFVLRWLFNSMFVTTVATAFMLITSAMAGYAFSRGDFIGKQLLFISFLGILMVPMTVRIVPTYMLMSSFGWTNTYWVLIGPWSASAFGTFFMRQQFASIPRDYDEAAIVDGASRLQVCFRIMVPMAKSGLVTLGILRFMSLWNTRAASSLLNMFSGSVSTTTGDSPGK